MAKKKTNPKSVALPVGVSPKAHEALKREAFASKPRLNLRQLINIKVGLSKDE